MIKYTLILLSAILLSCTNTKKEIPENKESKVENKSTENQIPDGEFIQKYPNGSVQAKGDMLNNKREGLWTAYYKNGFKQSESTYQSGVLHGRTASFYTNGQVRYIGYFMGGKKDGKWEFYTEDGQFEKSEIYVKGKVKK